MGVHNGWFVLEQGVDCLGLPDPAREKGQYQSANTAKKWTVRPLPIPEQEEDIATDAMTRLRSGLLGPGPAVMVL